MSRGAKWTEEDIDRAFTLQARGLSYRQIAETLGRSFMAVKDKMQEVRCSGDAGYSEAAIRASSDRFAADIARSVVA